MIRLKPINYFLAMLALALFVFSLTHFLTFPGAVTSSAFEIPPLTKNPRSAFSDIVAAFHAWDSQVGCDRFGRRYDGWSANRSALQDFDVGGDCAGVVVGSQQKEGGRRNRRHVSVLVKGWTWIPDGLDNLYECRCGLSCLWSKSEVLVDRPDALLFENVSPPQVRKKGDPLRVYMDLEPSRKPTGVEDIFIGYHVEDDVQTTYAGAFYHNNRNYHVSSYKSKNVLVYWSSSRCLPQRNKLAKEFLSLVPHHSFGKCLNNMNGRDMALSLYPECSVDKNSAPKWWDHLHCAMSHYKFVLAIENTITDSYVTEKLYYALDSGSVPIYFGAPNVWDFVPPHSIIDGSKFSSMEELAKYVKALADDPVAYAEYHAWRRCGVLGNYGKTRSISIDTLPCRLCELISRKGGRNANA